MRYAGASGGGRTPNFYMNVFRDLAAADLLKVCGDHDHEQPHTLGLGRSSHGRGGRMRWRPWPPRAGLFGRRSVSGPEPSSPLQGRREGRIEIVTLNRPAQRNAMSAALVDELIAAISA